MQVPLGRTFLSFLLFLEHHHHHYQQQQPQPQQPQPPSTEIIAILGRLPSFDSPFYFLLRIFLFLFSLSVSFSAHSHTPTDRTGSPYLITPTSCILFTHTHTIPHSNLHHLSILLFYLSFSYLPSPYSSFLMYLHVKTLLFHSL